MVRPLTPFSTDRTDRQPNPRPDLPVLLVFSNKRRAYDAQRRLHPADFYCTYICGPLMGRRFRAIFFHIDDVETNWRFAVGGEFQNDIDKFYRWKAEYLPTLLAPGCEDQIHHF